MPVLLEYLPYRKTEDRDCRLALFSCFLRRGYAVAMKAKGITQTEMAARMRTSRMVVRRLLDENDTSITLATLARASAAVGIPLTIRMDARQGKMAVRAA